MPATTVARSPTARPPRGTARVARRRSASGSRRSSRRRRARPSRCRRDGARARWNASKSTAPSSLERRDDRREDPAEHEEIVRGLGFMRESWPAARPPGGRASDRSRRPTSFAKLRVTSHPHSAPTAMALRGPYLVRPRRWEASRSSHARSGAERTRPQSCEASAMCREGRRRGAAREGPSARTSPLGLVPSPNEDGFPSTVRCGGHGWRRCVVGLTKCDARLGAEG